MQTVKFPASSTAAVPETSDHTFWVSGHLRTCFLLMELSLYLAFARALYLARVRALFLARVRALSLCLRVRVLSPSHTHALALSLSLCRGFARNLFSAEEGSHELCLALWRQNVSLSLSRAQTLAFCLSISLSLCLYVALSTHSLSLSLSLPGYLFSAEESSHEL